MSPRKTILATGEFYHIFNRSINNQPIFVNKRDCQRFIDILFFYQKNPKIRFSHFINLPLKERENIFEQLNKNKKLVEILAFVLMPNHFHLMLQQKEDNGISIFLSRATNSYTRYYNTKHKRKGDLFESVFKAVRIETEEQLIHLSRYIHINPVVSLAINEENLVSYPWSSFPDYLRGNSSVLDLKPVLNRFANPQDYKKFVFDQIGYGKELEKIKHLLLEK